MQEIDIHTPEFEVAKQEYSAAFGKSFSYLTTGFYEERDGLLGMIWHHREVVIVAQQDKKDGPLLLPDVIQQRLNQLFPGVPIIPQSLAFTTDRMTVHVEPVDSLQALQSEDQQFIFVQQESAQPSIGIGKEALFMIPNGSIQVNIKDDRLMGGLSPKIANAAFDFDTINAITRLLEETSRRISSRVEIRQVRGFFGSAHSISITQIADHNN